MPNYAGVKFADREQLDSLEKYGYCAFVIAKKDKHSFHPDIGDIVHLLLDETDSGRRSPVRLVADQHMPDGSLISIYVPSYGIWEARRN